MFTIELTLNAFVFAAIVLGTACIGYAVSRGKIVRKRFRIAELEHELIRNHAEILMLQKEFIAIELQLHNAKDSVVVMKNVLKPESAEKLPDVSLRKKLLGVEASPVTEESYPLPYKIRLSKEA
jgi:hypothetical protein